ncbi:basic proline-rich protein-like [Canis lupus familiaris]|uniref:basic proline-rich protein-like n=1 Tax=Canis lupus familiaris TaxID=9615 RepID=UPI0018F7DA05|nr:basic proline-rich protein-like [Canis lupus familiaris]
MERHGGPGSGVRGPGGLAGRAREAPKPRLGSGPSLVATTQVEAKPPPSLPLHPAPRASQASQLAPFPFLGHLLQRPTTALRASTVEERLGDSRPCIPKPTPAPELVIKGPAWSACQKRQAPRDGTANGPFGPGPAGTLGLHPPGPVLPWKPAGGGSGDRQRVPLDGSVAPAMPTGPSPRASPSALCRRKKAKRWPAGAPTWRLPCPGRFRFRGALRLRRLRRLRRLHLRPAGAEPGGASVPSASPRPASGITTVGRGPAGPAVGLPRRRPRTPARRGARRPQDPRRPPGALGRHTGLVVDPAPAQRARARSRDQDSPQASLTPQASGGGSQRSAPAVGSTARATSRGQGPEGSRGPRPLARDGPSPAPTATGIKAWIRAHSVEARRTTYALSPPPAPVTGSLTHSRSRSFTRTHIFQADTLPLPAPPAKTETLGDHTWRSPFSKPQEVAHTPHSKHPYAWVTGVRFDPDSRAQGCNGAPVMHSEPSPRSRTARGSSNVNNPRGTEAWLNDRHPVGHKSHSRPKHGSKRLSKARPPPGPTGREPEAAGGRPEGDGDEPPPPVSGRLRPPRARRRPLASPDPCKEGPGRPQLQRAIADALDCPGPPSRLPVRTPPPTPPECPLHEAYRPPRGFPSDHEAQVRTPSTSRREPPRTTKGARAARARKGPAPTQVDRPDGRWRGTGPRQGRATRASPSSAAGAGPGFAPGSPIRVRARAPRHPRAGPVTEAAAGVPCPGDRSALRDLSSRRVSASPPTLPTRLVKQEQASEPSPPCSSVSVSVSGPGRPGSSPLGRCPSSAGAFREPDVCEEKGRRRRGGGGGGGATPEDARGLLVDACGREGTTHPGPSSTRVWATGTAGASTEVGPRDPEREPPPGPWTGRRVPDYWSTGADGAGPPGPGDGAPLPGASPQKRGVRACLLARPPPPLHPRPEWPSGRALDMRAAMLGRGTADTGWAAEFSGLAFFSSGRGRRLRPWGKGRLAFAVQYCHQAESPRRIREPSAELSLPRGGAPGVTWECGGGGRTGTDGMERHGGPGSGVRGPGGLAGRAREAPSHGSARAPPWWPPRLGGTGAG